MQIMNICAARAVIAYIDPSAMTYIIQIIAGVAIAAGAAFGFYIRRIKRAFSRFGKKDDDSADGYSDGADGWDDDDDTGMGDYDIPASGTEVPEAVASVPASVSASERSAPVSAAVRASTVPEAGSGGGGFTVGESDVGGSDVGESDVGSDDFPDLPDLEELEDFDGTGAPAPQPDRYDETGGEGGLLAENRELRRLLAIERRRVEILKQALHVCTGDRGR